MGFKQIGVGKTALIGGALIGLAYGGWDALLGHPGLEVASASGIFIGAGVASGLLGGIFVGALASVWNMVVAHRK